MVRQRIKSEDTKEMRRLEAALRSTLAARDFEGAKRCVGRITTILCSAGHETRSLKYKNAYFEAIMEAGDLMKAIAAFKSLRNRAPKGTRVRLESTTLLAIAHLRANQSSDAKPLILEVMRDETVIHSAERRKEFRCRAYERFDQEIVLAACRGIGRDSLDIDRIAIDAEELARGSEATVLKALADSTP